MKRSNIFQDFVCDLTYMGNLNDDNPHLIPLELDKILSYPFIKCIIKGKAKIFPTNYLSSDSGKAGATIPAGYTVDYTVFEHYDDGAGEATGLTFVIMEKDANNYVIIGEV